LHQKEERVRVYVLARELNMESKDLLDMCRESGIDVKNQLSSLTQEQRDQVEQLARSRGGVTTAAPPRPLPPQVPQRMRVLDSRPRTPEPQRASQTPPPPTFPPPVVAEVPPGAGEAHVAPPVSPAVPAPAPASTPLAPAAEAPTPASVTAPAPTPTEAPVPLAPAAQGSVPAPVTPSALPVAPAAQAPPTTPQVPPAPSTTTVAPQVTGPRPPEPPATPRVPTGIGPAKMRDLGTGRPDGSGFRDRQRRPPPRPPVSIRVATPPPLKQRAPEPQKPAEPVAQKKFMELPDDVKKGQRVITNANELLNKKPPVSPAAPVPPAGEEPEDDGDKPRRGPGQVGDRKSRHEKRAERQKARKGREGEPGRGGDVALLDDDGARPGKKLKRLVRHHGPQPRKGKVPIEVPITVRSLSEAIGVRSVDLLFKLKEHGINATNLNVMLEPDMAETLALEYGSELEVKRPHDAEEQLLSDLEQPDNPEDVVLRAPIVTVMGHVDHGKTSLLDKIRRSNVAATETGGITQVIRAWRVEYDGRPITFLDTPGHEAFTEMRARGANVTDIAVIVVACDDGVMRQTEEAINHAKAAGVSMVVALNKTDLPGANVDRTRRQLYGLDVLPDNMGGDVPFVETSAATGKGIEELLENILLVAELKELKANPNKPAHGTCLEAMLSEGEGVVATMLVEDGTLHRGDILVCGGAFGRVRALYDDLGRAIEDAGPGVPVRLTGLDEVPNASDPFQVVPDLATAREVAEKRQAKQHAASVTKREPVRLENLSDAKVAELKVILKADFRGSIEAIRKELEKLQHEEVRVRILEAAIGGITESDVWLALTSPEDTIIVGFNAVPDERARALAEERKVQLREYNIIYQLTDDIKAALEGKLKPREEVVHLGRASVRETFKISRVGTIAGCYVTQGKIERSAKVRVIRNGIVVYPPADRTASLESLKRFKEDVREVAAGFECGIKIAGYDDVKGDDVIEAYRIETVQRTLD
jgi:translation initiation factor IF-2